MPFAFLVIAKCDLCIYERAGMLCWLLLRLYAACEENINITNEKPTYTHMLRLGNVLLDIEGREEAERGA